MLESHSQCKNHNSRKKKIFCFCFQTCWTYFWNEWKCILISNNDKSAKHICLVKEHFNDVNTFLSRTCTSLIGFDASLYKLLPYRLLLISFSVQEFLEHFVYDLHINIHRAARFTTYKRKVQYCVSSAILLITLSKIKVISWILPGPKKPGCSNNWRHH